MLLLYFFIACGESHVDEPIIKYEVKYDSKSEFFALPTSQQNTESNLRIEYLKNYVDESIKVDLENLQKTLIDDRNLYFLSDNQIQIAINLCKKLPQTTFISTFEDPTSEIIVNVEEGICNFCLEDLLSYKQDKKSFKGENNFRAIDCNYNWACTGGTSLGAPCECTIPACGEGEDNDSCCEATSSGCGFLGTGPCDEADVIDCEGHICN